MPAFRTQYVLRFYGLCAVVALCFLFVILCDRYLPRTITPDAPLVAKDTVTIYFGKCKIGKLRTFIEGCVFKKGTQILIHDTKVLLKAVDGTYYYIPSQFIRRPDVTKHENDGKNYDASGFIVYGLSPRLFAQGPFAVYILYKNDDEKLLIDTGVVL